MAKIVIDMPDLYDVKEAAQAMGVGVITVWRRIKAGRLVPVKVGNRTLIPISEIQRATKEIEVTNDGLMSVQETARAIGHCRYSVYKWIADGKIKALKVGGITRVPTSEVERLNREGNAQAAVRLRDDQGKFSKKRIKESEAAKPLPGGSAQ